jgi:hypothetical protein
MYGFLPVLVATRVMVVAADSCDWRNERRLNDAGVTARGGRNAQLRRHNS